MTAESLLAPILVLLMLALLCGGALGFATLRFRVEGNPLVDRINTLLPQTQCGQCGYPGCKPYAASIADGGAINKCPPGGKATIAALADLLGVAALPLDATHGVEGIRKVAYIREAECIGCTKCIQACPVDAILGSAKHMHTVIVSECTGCDLCVAPCPVDCIDMVPAQAAPQPLPPAEPVAVITTAASTLPVAALHQACIRCGLCAEVCPVQLLPQQLYWFARSKEYDKAQSYNLQACTECGDCATVCPSHIPLVQYFRSAKADIRELHDKQQRAIYAKQRFEVHQQRIAFEQEQEIRRRAERAALAKAQATAAGTSAQDAIAAALARVQAKKAAQSADANNQGDKA